MSLIGDFIGGTADALAEKVDETSENKRVLAERLRQEKAQRSENDRQYNRARKDEDRRLGREVKEQYPDLDTKEMVTIYQNGTEQRRPLRASELKAMEREDREFEGKERYQNAIIAQMNRPSGSRSERAPAKPSDSEARAAATLQVGAEPDANRDPELHAKWVVDFNRAFLAAKSGAAAPGTKRPLPGVVTEPMILPPDAVSLPDGTPSPRETVRLMFERNLPVPPKSS